MKCTISFFFCLLLLEKFLSVYYFPNKIASSFFGLQRWAKSNRALLKVENDCEDDHHRRLVAYDYAVGWIYKQSTFVFLFTWDDVDDDSVVVVVVVVVVSRKKKKILIDDD